MRSSAQSTGEAQLEPLVATRTPRLVTMAYRVSEADRAYARAFYARAGRHRLWSLRTAAAASPATSGRPVSASMADVSRTL